MPWRRCRGRRLWRERIAPPYSFREEFWLTDFYPDDIADLLLWVKADAGTYQDDLFTTPAAADGDPVGGWKDQGTLGNHLTQATAGHRPLLKLNQVGSLPMILADGVDDIIASQPLAALTARTLFLVGKRSAYQVTQRIWGLESSEASVFDNNATWGYYKANGGVVNLGGDPTTLSMITFRQTAAAVATAQIGTAATTALALDGPPGQRIDLFASTHSGTDPFSGWIAEMLHYSRALTPSEITLVQAYLTRRWGL